MSIRLFEDKRVLLGITGSIACYKSLDLASMLTQAGAAVDIILTDSAMKFVQPLSFSSLTGRPAYWDMWSLDDHILHVKLAESADIVVVAPITAQTIAKLAHGLADNLLTVSILASRSSLMIAPAMDAGMYEHQATRENLSVLRERGAFVAGPAEGRMASGLVGPGRMLEAADLFDRIRYSLGREGRLKNKSVLVTAGPTEEPLDPVRFLTNRSTGKQGVALAQAALDAGADVSLITGPIEQRIPFGLEHINVRTAKEMHETVMEKVQGVDALLMAAAVSDYAPKEVMDRKIKKDINQDKPLSLELTRNPDILKAVAQHRQNKDNGPAVVVGFAAETNDHLESGERKMRSKEMDFIAINDVLEAGSGFAGDTNRVIILGTSGERWDLPLQEKSNVAEKIIELVIDLLVDSNSTAG